MKNFPSTIFPDCTPKSPTEIDAELEAKSGDTEQVNPYKADSSKWARYQLLQGDFEVGWVFVQGQQNARCNERWQLYKIGATGRGATLPRGLHLPNGGTTPQKAPYKWPSQNEKQAEGMDVSTRVIYVDAVSDPATKPAFCAEVSADCSEPLVLVVPGPL